MKKQRPQIGSFRKKETIQKCSFQTLPSLQLNFQVDKVNGEVNYFYVVVFFFFNSNTPEEISFYLWTPWQRQGLGEQFLVFSATVRLLGPSCLRKAFPGIWLLTP